MLSPGEFQRRPDLAGRRPSVNLVRDVSVDERGQRTGWDALRREW